MLAGPVPASGVPTSVDAELANQTSTESIPDEDPLQAAIADPNVLAEVKLATKPSE
jgi:hypothetical protein